MDGIRKYVLYMCFLLPGILPAASMVFPEYFLGLIIFLSLASLSLVLLIESKINNIVAAFALLFALSFVPHLIFTTPYSYSLEALVWGSTGPIVVFCILSLAVFVAPLTPIKFNQYYFYSSAVLSFLSLLFVFSQSVKGYELTGVVSQSNLLGTIAGLGLIAGYFYLKEKKMIRPYEIILLITMFLALVLTRARTAIGLVLVFYVFELFRQLVKKDDKKRLIAIFLAFLAVLSISFTFYKFKPREIMFASYYRLQMVDYGAQLAKVIQPWGIGLRGVIQYSVVDKLPSELEISLKRDNAIMESTHNLFLDYLLYYGWLPFMAFVIILAYTTVCAFRSKDRRARQLLVMLWFVIFQALYNPLFFGEDIILWILIFGILHTTSSNSNIKIRSYNLLLSFLILIALTALLVYIDESFIVKERISRGLVFPLMTTKKDIEKGSTYKEETLTWYSNAKMNYHHDYEAVDIHVHPDTNVLAAKAGEVVKVRDEECDKDEKKFPMVAIKSHDGMIYYYTHLKPGSILATENTKVSAGDIIAQVGSSDCAEGSASHLHFEVRRDDLSILPRLITDLGDVDTQGVLSQKYKTLEAGR